LVNGILGLLPQNLLTAISDGSVSKDVIGKVVDAAPAHVEADVTSNLGKIGRSGILRVKLTLDEPAHASVSAKIRPGRAADADDEADHSQALIGTDVVDLDYDVPGTRVFKSTLDAEAHRTLGRSRDAKLTLKVVTTDLLGRETTQYVKTKIRR
jgi:hypothetical protein